MENNIGYVQPVGKQAFTNPLFLTMAVLISVNAAISIFDGTFNVISILLAIAFWLVFSAAKSQEEPFKTTGLKMASGTIKALWILTWVVGGFIGFAGICCFASSSLASSLEFLTGAMLQYTASLIGIIFLVAMAVVFVINVLFISKLHMFVKSLCLAAENPQLPVVKASYCGVWLLVMGILQAVSSFGNGTLYTIYGLTLAAAQIVAYVWIKKCNFAEYKA